MIRPLQVLLVLVIWASFLSGQLNHGAALCVLASRGGGNAAKLDGISFIAPVITSTSMSIWKQCNAAVITSWELPPRWTVAGTSRRDVLSVQPVRACHFGRVKGVHKTRDPVTQGELLL